MPRSDPRRLLVYALWGAAALAVLVFIMAVVGWLTDGGLDQIEADLGEGRSYLWTFLLIAGDAVIPILPGETTLNTAAVLASNGELELPLVMVAGALGAIVGDSALYWIARAGSSSLEPQLERARQDKNIGTVLRILGDEAPLLIVAGRYVPGVRFFVNATMGLTRLPYPTFLLWSSIGGVLWAVYTAGLAYLVGSRVGDFPVASILISGAITTALLALVFVLERRRGRI